MTSVFVTTDTELSLGSHKRGLDFETNVRRSFFGGDVGYGIDWQARRLREHGLTGVFFVDPVPAALFGDGFLRRVVETVLDHGHEVQLHVHTEWLPLIDRSPVAGRTGVNLGDFGLDDQIRLLDFARALLVAAGAPAPVAFRAGNYGANDDTLAALAALGIAYDSSFNGAFAATNSRISLPADTADAVVHRGVIEVPVTCFRDWPKGLRHVQLCAVSAAETRAALDHAVASGTRTFTLVSHSFELLSRDRLRTNRTTVVRFEAMCDLLAARRDVAPTRGLTGLALEPTPGGALLRMPPLKVVARMAEQWHANRRYERGT